MITKFNSFESLSISKQLDIVYHGTDIEHDFSKKGHVTNGTFFSTSKNEASSYAGPKGIIYEVKIRPDLNLFDTNNLYDCKKLLDYFGELYDNYYHEEDEKENYLIDTPEKLYELTDNWSPIENTPDVLEWLDDNYDGAIIYEGGVKNILLFFPIEDKILTINKL